MALAATTAFEVQTTGSDINGGGFDSVLGASAQDYTYGGNQQVISYSDIAVNGLTTTQVTSASRPFVANDAGNIINVPGGGATTFRAALSQSLTAAGASFDFGSSIWCCAIWIKLDVTPAATTRTVFGKNKWGLQYNTTTSSFSLMVDNGSVTNVGSVLFFSGTWGLFVFGRSASTTFSMQSNTSAATTATVSSGYTITADGSDLFLGGSNLSGAIRGVGIWTGRYLTAGEIVALHNSGFGRTYSELASLGLTTNLTAWWDNPYTLTDQSGNGHTLTNSNGAFEGDGLPVGGGGGAANFTGSSQYLSVADSALLSGNGTSKSFAVSAWVFFHALPTSSLNIVGKDSTSSAAREYAIRYNSASARFQFVVSNDGTATTTVTSTVAVTAATWFFVLGYYDTATNQIVIRVNTTSTSASHTTGVVNGSNQFWVGGNSEGYINGRIDNVGFWDKAFTTTDLTNIYNSAAGRAYNQLSAASPSLLTNLVAYWNMDETSGTRNDSHSNAINLSSNNGVGRGSGKTVGFTSGRYQITSVSGGVATVDRAIGQVNATSGTGRLGGALASPAVAVASKVAGSDVYIKSGTYIVSTIGTTSVAGGFSNDSVSSTPSNPSHIEGYQSTRGDGGTRPIIRAVVTNGSLLNVIGNGTIVNNIDFDGNGQASVVGLAINATARAYDVKITNAGSIGLQLQGSSSARRVEVSDSTGTAVTMAGTSSLQDFYIHDNTGASAITISGTSVQSVMNGVLENNNGASTDGILISGASSGAVVRNVSIYGCGRDGVRISVAAMIGGLFNVISYGNGGETFNNSLSSDAYTAIVNCAGDSAPTSLTAITNFITLTEDPFTDAANGDFSLNNAAGGGALLRAAATDPLGQTSYGDVGAVQSRGATETSYVF